MKRLLAGIALGVVFTASAAWADDTADLWKAKCKSCHGDNGNADTKVGKQAKIADFTSPDWQKKKTDADIKKAIAEGVKDTKMKAFKDKLSDSEIDSLVKYIRGLKKS